MRTMQTMARGRETGSVNSLRSRRAQHGPTRRNQRGVGRPSRFVIVSQLPVPWFTPVYSLEVFEGTAVGCRNNLDNRRSQ
jgi:hypothetical protein